MKRRDFNGENNPFYGRHHSKESIAKGKSSRDMSIWKTEEFAEGARERANARVTAGRKQKSNFEYWVERYGEDRAAELDLSWRAKQSLANSGKNNAMYGKPSPGGAGNGWKGYIDGRFFRSLRELKFIIDHPESISAESNEWRAEFNWLGKSRTTIPDFVLHSSNLVVECKPERLIDSPLNNAKAKALKDLCVSKGYVFKMFDPGIPTELIISKLICNGRLKFTATTQDRYLKWLER